MNMNEIILATIRANDEEEGEIIEIRWDGEKVVLSNGEDPCIGEEFENVKEAADTVWAAWGNWFTFNYNDGCIDED